ncbi:MAG TPA: glycosyltransferase [Methylomirabilota bacterium]|nr:glycosyltransferase [Methylomirabilota bacterium]
MPRLTVLIATCNRARALRETLEAMTRVDRSGLEVEWVVVDNNSTDDTAAVIHDFASRLPLKSLFVARPGKNCALNEAINTFPLGELVVFTDDDVTPDRGWLRAMAAAGARWPRCSVFGGPIQLAFPEGEPPAWCRSRFVEDFAFCRHDHGPEERIYPPGRNPYGANLAVRRQVFERGLRYNEEVGPRPKDRKIGSETTFLETLARHGYEMIYVPSAVIHHRISSDQCRFSYLRRRAYRFGKGRIHFGRFPNQRLLAFSRPLWRMRQGVRLVMASLTFLASYLIVPPAWRAKVAVRAGIGVGLAVEGLRRWRPERLIEAAASGPSQPPKRGAGG